jgi:hypothetical protein
MKKTMQSTLVLAVAALLCLPALAFAMSHGQEMMPKPEGKSLIKYLDKAKYQESWALFPGKGKLYEGRHPHGAFLTTYVNDKALKALQERTGMLPDGAIIVKENYSPEKQLMAITTMYRVKGYNADAGDWFWIKSGPDGAIMAEGKVEGCISCHGSVIMNDWLFTGPVK